MKKIQGDDPSLMSMEELDRRMPGADRVVTASEDEAAPPAKRARGGRGRGRGRRGGFGKLIAACEEEAAALGSSSKGSGSSSSSKGSSSGGKSSDSSSSSSDS